MEGLLKSENYLFDWIRAMIFNIINTNSFITNVELLCDRGVRKTFSDEFLYNNDSKRVPEKVFLSTSRRRVVKHFLRQALNHYLTGTSLKMSHFKCIIVEFL